MKNDTCLNIPQTPDEIVVVEHKSISTTVWPKEKGWVKYVVGVLAQFNVDPQASFDFAFARYACILILTPSNVPIGGGLSSSAALEIAMDVAMCALLEVG